MPPQNTWRAVGTLAMRIHFNGLTATSLPFLCHGGVEVEILRAPMGIGARRMTSFEVMWKK